MSANELMYANWQEIIRPDKVQISASTPSYGKFICEPLERGFGVTIGNSLRRIILSSLWGAAIVSIKIEGVMHEFSTIPGVLEDVSEIILNLKEVRFKITDRTSKEIHIDVSGREGAVTAGDIVCGDQDVVVLNPDKTIATLKKDGVMKMTMIVQAGRGYSLAESNKQEESPEGAIPIDAVFTPVRRVSYEVSNARVGQRTDYDKLTMEIWTDGSVFPEDAVAYAAKILKEQLTIFINFDEEREPVPEKREEEKQKPNYNDNLYRSVEELELSVRSANCLKNADIHKIYQLVSKTESEMLKTKNFGRKSLNEIKDVLSEMGLSLGMKMDGFVMPEEENTEEGE